MAKYYLKFTGELVNVTDLQPYDFAEDPFEYTFKIQCTDCREIHDKPVGITRFETHELSRSRGEANFVYKCRQCKAEHSTTITRTREKITAEKSNNVLILSIDARGMDIIEFIPDGFFECSGTLSNKRFTEVDLEDHEWYDYDDSIQKEVSIINAKWEISRS